MKELFTNLVYMPRKGRTIGLQEPRERPDGPSDKAAFYIGEHLEQIAKELGLVKDGRVNGYQLAKKIGKAQSLVSRWLRNNRAVEYKTIKEVAERLRVPVDKLISGICDTLTIPVYEHVAAGFWVGQTSEYPSEYINVDKSKLRRFGLSENRVVGIRVKGDSMEPEIREGDIVLVADPAWLEPKNDDVVVVWMDGEGVVKRLKRERGAIRLISRNTKYKDIVISVEDVKSRKVVMAKVIELERVYN